MVDLRPSPNNAKLNRPRSQLLAVITPILQRQIFAVARSKSFGIRSIAILLPFLLLSVVAGQYRFDNYSTDNGLPQNSVHAILQTRDGYLWFTTFDGLIRYDGVRLVVFDKATTRGLVSNRFDSLLETPDGVLWAGTQDGGVK